MENLKIITFLLVFSSLVSCSDDSSNSSIDENLMTINKSVTFTPQQTNFTQKRVKYFDNNKIVLDSLFNNLNQFVSRNTYTYNSGNTTIFNYNASNQIIYKVVYNYDNLNRLVSKNKYDAANLLTNSTTITYQNENVYLTQFSNGISTLLYHYKTNSDGYLYYEKALTNNNHIRTLDYTGNIPNQLNLNIENYTVEYNYHSQIKPANMQKSAIETNNYALINGFMEHVIFSCNFYLNQVVYNIGSGPVSIQRDYLFNDNNYETYFKEYSGSQNYSETFTYYN
jgi:hypothetical protein